MKRNIAYIFIILVATILFVSVEARHGVSGDRESREVTFEGEAWWTDENGTSILIPVSECPYKCAIGQVCAAQNQCEDGGHIIAIIFGLLAGVGLIYCIWNYYCRDMCCQDEKEKENKEPLIR